MAVREGARLSLGERRAKGGQARERAPLSGHSGWRPAADRADPVALLEAQDLTREPDLVPVRHGRMMVSPFTFYRGAAKIMPNFILGWQAAAAAAGAAVAEGAAAGAVGRGGVPPLASWMILPDLTSPATQTVLPSNDALYGAAHVELDRLGPLVIHVPANLDDRYFSVAVMDAHLNNVAHIGPRWTGNGATDHLLVPPGWHGRPRRAYR